MANPEHVEIVKRGADAIAEWRRPHPYVRLDLRAADLSGADLREADLRQADLHRTDLTGSVVRGSDLRGADLTAAILSNADLSGADLSWADLGGANLRGADLIGAYLCGAELDRADLSEAHLGVTSLSGCDLSRAVGLETVFHGYSSHVDVDTLALTLERAGGCFTQAQVAFFEEAGVPRTLLDYLPDLLETQPLQFFSCFISFGGSDVQLADQLYRDLKGRGIRCYKYDEDAIIGRGVWANISRAITLHEKMIVICSESSLQRPGVQGEIERALQKEEQLQKGEGGEDNPDIDADVLVPVRLDDHVLEGWEHPRKADVIAKHIGDFRGWQDAARYKKAFEQLLRALDPRSKLGLSTK